MSAAAPLLVLRDARQASALLHPVRRKMLNHLSEPGSASSLAREFAMPRQQLNYHLRELESAGFVEFVEERRKGNCTERLVRATAKAYLISPEALGELGPTAETRRDRFSAAYLVATAGRLIQELATVAARARRANKRIATLTLESEVRFASPEDRNAYAEELANTLARLSAKYHQPGTDTGRTFRVVTGVYPAITKQDEDTAAAVPLE